ncbi:MAG: efflux RND transporter periplasmic adaptor subunit, partial [Phycisphaerales bacterium]|nr:efflux RND transporter periplasmic adaptor subunit [Phycisphaerales bacterium]
FLDRARRGDLQALRFGRVPTALCRVSINCIAWFGAVMAIGGGVFLGSSAGRPARQHIAAWLAGDSMREAANERTAAEADDAHSEHDGHDHSDDGHDHRAHAAQKSGADGTCETHGLVAAKCPFCDNSIITRLGMCAEHAVPEALCWKCDKNLVEAYRKMNDWCGGHDRPESFCSACNGPHASDKWMALVAAKPNDATHADTQPRIQRAPSPACNASDNVIELANAEVAQRSGLTHVTVAKQVLSSDLVCNAEVEYDGSRYAQITARVAGVVREVRANLGDVVKAGQPLVVIDSAELAAAKADTQQSAAVAALAEKTLAREQSLLARGISSEREVSEAETKLAEARIALTRAERRLGALGLTTDEIARVTAGDDNSATLSVNAPFDGVIVARSAVIGESVDISRALFALADTARMWVMLDVPDSGAPLSIGQEVEFNHERIGVEPLLGRLTWISTEIDHKTRNLKARAEFENADGLLRAHQFGRARVLLGEPMERLTAPRSAVQWDGCCNVVFVKTGDRQYRPRKVRLGWSSGDTVEVLEGLEIGETVVAQGSFLLKTEIKKGEIGAGCCPGEVATKK